MSLLVKNVLLSGKMVDIHVIDNVIALIGTDLSDHADRTIDGRGKAVIPGFVNGHGHAAMTLFRGFADDMPLRPWLEKKIWPNEAKLTRSDIYWGTKLACLEMIKSGTTTFMDMYFHYGAIAEAACEMGMRAVISAVLFDSFDPEKTLACQRSVERLYEEKANYSRRIKFSLGPHAIYTVSGELLRWAHRFAMEHNLLIHLHLAETQQEVADSVRDFGMTPVRYLYKLGVLSPRLVIAHGLYVDDDEIRMLADHQVKVVHNPASNMKLASGGRFKFDEMRAAGVTVGLGTDGCSSSNNLDMVEAMKLASLLGKVWRGDPEATPATAVFEAATRAGGRLTGWDIGRLEVGALADFSLIDLDSPVFTPNYNLISNLVYAANGSCVDTVVCDGRVLMENRVVEGEREILEEARRRARKFE